MEKRKEIVKPLSLARSEFIDAMTHLINNSMLPPFIIESVLKDMYSDVRLLSKKQLEKDMQQYEEMLRMRNEETQE